MILSSGFGNLVLLERTHKGHLVLFGLEATMTHFGTGVDELELDFLKSLPLGVNEERLKMKSNILKIVREMGLW